MSTSILYHAFNIKGVKHCSTEFIGNSLVLSAEMTDKFIRCPRCGCRRVLLKGSKTRWLRMSPIGRKQSHLALKLHRCKCTQCGRLWWPQLPFMDGKHRYTRSFALTVLDLLRFGTIQDVANFLNVGWDLVKEVHKTKLQHLYRMMPIHKIKYLGIDEFSIKKAHHYMTIFIDLESGRIVHAVEGTSKADIALFLELLAKKAKKLKAIAMDMSRSYSSAVSQLLPKAKIVFDRYHIMAIMNQAIDRLRRQQQSSLEGPEKQTLKGCRFLLLRNYESLNNDYQMKLDTLLAINKPLFIMHSMKEQLRLLWSQADHDSGKRYLNQWCFDALMSGIRQLAKVAMTLIKHREGIPNYFPHQISSGLVEGTINKIKTLKRQAYGFRDMAYFKLRLYHLHCQGYSFAG